MMALGNCDNPVFSLNIPLPSALPSRKIDSTPSMRVKMLTPLLSYSDYCKTRAKIRQIYCAVLASSPSLIFLLL